MSRENPRKYPRSIESKNSYLRIRAPENLDIALEGLIRKVLKEQPKMDDIYAFAADYFDMLLKIREKAGIRKLSAQDICPYHNEDDAREMVKLASSFAKRTKPHQNMYKVLTMRHPEQRQSRKSSDKLESKGLDTVNEESQVSDRIENVLSVVKGNTESGKSKNEPNESESTENDTSYTIKASGQEIGEEVFIRANEVVTDYDAEEDDSPRDNLGNVPETVGDINELRDKIKAVENEIKLLDSKENKSENGPAGGDVAGGVEESLGEIGKAEENSEEGALGRSAEENSEEVELGRGEEDGKEAGTSLTEEKEVTENSVEEKSQETQEEKLTSTNAGEPEDDDVNLKNDDASDEKLEDEQDIKTNAENEESEKVDVETEKKDVESETQDVSADSVEKEEETKPSEEIRGEETQPEAEEVKSSGDDTNNITGTSPEKQADDNEISEPNTTETVGQDEAWQQKEKEVMGEENLKSEKVESEKLVQEEREAMEVQISEVTNAEVIEKEDTISGGENSEVHEDTEFSDKAPEETEQTEEDPIRDAGTHVNVTDTIPPVLLGSAVSETKNVEAPEEESPSTEENLVRDDVINPEQSIATEIEKFLDSEREHSSNDKAAEEREPTAATEGNSVETEIVSRAVPVLGTVKENEEVLTQGEDTFGKEPGVSEKIDDLEPDNQEGSTTSDEMEFEISPAKYQELTTITEAKNNEMGDETKAEPEIILELSPENEKSEEQAEEHQNEPKKVFLEVPELLLDEKVRKSGDLEPETEDAVQEPEDKAIPECGNIGNEVIQKGEVEKVELVEGDEDILQVHLTTTIETEQDPRDSVHVEMVSRIDPTFKVSVETRVESPVQDAGNTENMKLIRAAVVIQNGFRRFKNKKISEERKQENKPQNNEDAFHPKEKDSEEPTHTLPDPQEDDNPSFEKETKRTLNLNETRTLAETQSLDSVRKASPLKTRSLSSIRYGVADFEVWNQLVKELEEAATKIQSNYRGYKTRKKLQRENAVQSTTTTSEDTASVSDLEIGHRHTGEFHDSLVLPLDPK